MIESIGVGFKEQIQKEQKLTGKDSQLLSDIKIGDVLKGSLTRQGNGQIVLLNEDNEVIPVKLQGMAIFNEHVNLEVIKKEAGQILLKLLQGEGIANELLQDKIMNELGLPKTDAMRGLIEKFLAKQMPFQKEELLKNYHMHQSFQIPLEVLTNLSEKAGAISLQEAKGMYDMKQSSMQQVVNNIGELISEVKDFDMMKDIIELLGKYLDESVIKEAFESNFKEQIQDMISIKQEGVVSLNEEDLAHQSGMIQETLGGDEADMHLKGEREANAKSLIDIEELRNNLTPHTWEKLGKITKSLVLKSLTVDLNRLQDEVRESRHIENAEKVLKELLNILEEVSVSEKYSQTLKQLDEMTQVVNKFNMQGEYYFFPMSLPQGEGKGELYFFKPKKKAKGEENHLYVVLALDLPALKNIEIHMRQENKNLLLHFKVKEERMLALIENQVKNLKQMMGQTRFNLDEIKVSLLEDQVVSPFLESKQNSINHMDFKI